MQNDKWRLIRVHIFEQNHRSLPARQVVFRGNGESERMTTAEPLLTATPADAVLNALPHPVIVVSADGKIADANVAAEAFSRSRCRCCGVTCCATWCRSAVPLLTLVEQVRARGAAVNEYKVDLATPRNPGDRAGRSARRAVAGAARTTSS